MRNEQFTYLFLLTSFLLLFLNSKAQDIEIGNGVNLQPSYYNNGHVTIGWELMQTYPEIEAVRIEIEPDRVSQAMQWIREAQENGYQVIATYHRATQLGSDEKDHLLDAANWWARNYDGFSQFGPIIINLMNEWGGHGISPRNFADAYNEALSIVRQVYSGQIIVDLPGFGHNIKVGTAAYPLIEDDKIIYSLHIYPTSVNVEDNSWVWVVDLDYLEAANIPWMIGEFGSIGTGGTNWCGIVEYAHQQNRPIFGWAWNGDGGNLNMLSPSWLEEPRARTFEPTPYLEEIVAALSGVDCFSQNFGEGFNSECLINEPCDDGNSFTINDRFNSFCVCEGTFTPALTPDSENSLFLYPNPTQNYLNVDISRLPRLKRLEIINSNGQKLFDLFNLDNLNNIEVNVASLPNGIYLVMATSADGNLITGDRFLKIN